jgi:TPR repeat protein
VNEIARHFLETYAKGGEVDGGWMFGKGLHQAELDFSEDSLERIDRLLDAIRERTKPAREGIVETARGRNFSALLAYYVMAYISRHTGAVIEWHDLESARASVPAGTVLPEGSTSRLVALAPDQGAALMPLGWIEDKLFGAGTALNAADYIASIVAHLERDAPITWWTAAHAMGVLVSHMMAGLANDAPAVATRVKPNAEGSLTFVSMIDERGKAAVDRGRAAMQDNVEELPWQVFAYDAFVTLPKGRCEAVVVELRTYADTPLDLVAVFPYRRASGSRPFAILDPTLSRSNEPAERVALVNAAMDKGIHSYPWPDGKSWNECRDPGGEPAQPPAEDIERLVIAAEEGLSQAQYELGLRYGEGDGVEQDYARCVYWYERAAAQGHGPAINNLADKYEHGLGIERDLDKAVGLYRQAAELNVIAAWYSLGRMAAEGRGVPRDLGEAVRWMKLAAQADFLDSKERLSKLERALYSGPLAAGEKALADAAKLGPQALYDVAAALYDPKVAESLPLAFKLFLHAARRGHAEAQMQVGFRYRRGLGVESNPGLALAWYERAARSGDTYAQEDLGELYETGELGKKDPERAFKYTLKAAEADGSLAPYRLARMYEEGRGTERNPAQALFWMEKAARFKIADAAERLAALRESAATAAIRAVVGAPDQGLKKKAWKPW